MTPEELIAEQDATITELRAALDDALRTVKRFEQRIAEDLGGEMGADDPYWERVYDRIRAAWDAWAFAELGTARPSHADLDGRPELAALWESVR